MKRLTFITVLVLLAMVVTACGTKATPAPAATRARRRPPRNPPRLRRPPRRLRLPSQPRPLNRRGAGCGRLRRQALAASAEGAASKGLTCLADAYAGKMKGKKVTMTGPFADEDAVKFNKTERRSRTRPASRSSTRARRSSRLRSAPRCQAGTAPDIIDFPQPGLAGFAKQGKVLPIDQARPRVAG